MSTLRFIEPPHSLEDRIRIALTRQFRFIGRNVGYRIVEDHVILTGSVKTFFQKQMAQETLRGIVGIERIVNELEVVAR